VHVKKFPIINILSDVRDRREIVRGEGPGAVDGSGGLRSLPCDLRPALSW
jgi:hypothetical protein